MTMIMILPNVFNNEVRLLVSPTVAVALAVSYTISRALASVTADNSIVDRNIIVNDIPTTAMALLSACLGICRLNSTTSFLFWIVASADAISTAMVTVFTPPAVPTGEPPINISSNDTNEDASVRFCCGTVAKPAVLVVMDWNMLTCILSNREYPPIVSGLLYSKIKNTMPPPNINIAVAVRAILLCRVRL